jgi:hypothetical protein
MFNGKVVEKIKPHILCSNFFSENRALYGIMRARQAADADADAVRFAFLISKPRIDTRTQNV